MKKIIRLTESDLTRIVKRVLRESEESVELQLMTTNNDKIIKSDVKREKNKNAIFRPTMSDSERKIAVEKKVQKEWNGHLNYLKERGLKPPTPKVEKIELERLRYDYGLSVGRYQWSDLVYGYRNLMTNPAKNETEIQKIVAATPKVGGFPVSNKDTYILYTCPSENNTSNEGTVFYNNIIKPVDESPNQEQYDKDWLSRYCDSINWKSRIGKKRNIFRNPKTIS